MSEGSSGSLVFPGQVTPCMCRAELRTQSSETAHCSSLMTDLVRGWPLTVLYTGWNVIILLCNVSLTFQFMFLSNCNRRECLNKTLFLNI